MIVRKFSRQREAILENLRRRRDHPTADTLYRTLRADFPHISLGTVYRNLNLLAEQKQIQKFSVNGTAVYDGNPEPHDHLFCTRCGQLYDIAGFYDDAMDHETASKNHVRILRHSVLYEGVCEECLKKEATTWN